MKRTDTAIQLSGVGKRYEIHHEKPTLVEKFTTGNTEIFWAVRHVDLTIQKGEKVGIIGRNGSGKTTLLKLIAGITTPTEGQIRTRGKVVSLIDLSAGFHPDLTGYQNIFVNGMLLGLSKRDIHKKLDDIIAFADIRQFIDAPLFTYSNGMALRLGFAVAVHADPDILLLDENLSAGDSNFQKKSKKKIQDFFRQGKTIVVVTQNLPFIAKTCSRFVYLKRGTVEGDGDQRIISQYDQHWKQP